MGEDLPPEDFERRLAEAGRAVVLYHASWCPHSRVFLPDFDEADAESPLPFLRADLRDLKDPRWEAHAVRVTPTVAYVEHGEELERLEAAPHTGIDADRFHAFLETVAALQEPEKGTPRRRPVTGRSPSRAS